MRRFRISRSLPPLAAAALASGLLGAQERAPQALQLELARGSLELHAAWDALSDTVYGFEKRFPWLAALEPVAATRSYGVETFRALLPNKAVALGEVYQLDARALLPFLRQLHAGATHELHHGKGVEGISAPGAFACVRAVSGRRCELWIRAHAEFLLQGDGTPGSSSWMTPAQFEGRLCIDRESKRVVSFRLSLPDQRANVDINIAKGKSYVADIGRFPRMELSSGRDERARYDSQITVAEARRRLARAFYPLARLEWLGLAEAWKRAKASKKPLHVIALFGSLDDESC